jgi:hypothetical protein
MGNMFTLRVHEFTELKPSFTAEENEGRFHIAIIHLVNVPVHKIQFCFTHCALKLLSTFEYMDANAAVLVHFVLICSHQANRSIGDISSTVPMSSRFAGVLRMFSACYLAA